MRYSLRRPCVRFQGGWLSSCARVRILMPKLFSDPEAIAEDIIRDVGTNLVVGLPLGLGKANHIINALYARAVADRSINLTLFSALTLEKPRPGSLLEKRFIGPVIDRLFGGYPDLDLCRRAACGRAAAQHPGDRVLLPGRKMAARAVSRSSTTSPRTTPTPRPICWRAGSMSSPNWWPSAWSMASRATA